MGRLTGIIAATCAAALFSVVSVEAFNLIVAHTRMGHPYKVNQQHAAQFIGFINDLERFYRPIRHLGCFSRWGHVSMSQHHTGNACDIEQFGWSRTTYIPMYRIGWLARKWGLRDGCSFRDCGHVDAGGPSWANGAPPGQIARAEIPATQNDVAEVGKDHEWPKTLVARSGPAKMILASTETKHVVAQVHEPKRRPVFRQHPGLKNNDDRFDIILRITKFEKHQKWLDALEDKIRSLPSARHARIIRQVIAEG